MNAGICACDVFVSSFLEELKCLHAKATLARFFVVAFLK